ncbi:hypothetical protein A1Q1_05969 [Trichosporon asahii var. asahii CBS 2479]|uniref:Uncharacterized protein n=1 Tax=Trichosporon asahii var. asahii (strain ATCC 90039 / CBS 2479 / JCM 2466 / KCTC 7840 / NBRC 103889/ NCYC 2677 / UAMH 7654) TaxID=1186058 RepID=J5Q586_TRIAS|nr:hypothetical protein A1Q1_05969 [Trichosporon asahii var. asahii CBS 2479]EJT45523.1 hypothetical protein A1Q1_05969 [Trichosporon asahii var. asahii CBS 2479]
MGRPLRICRGARQLPHCRRIDREEDRRLVSENLPPPLGGDRIVRLGRTHSATVEAILLLLDQKGQYHHDIWPHGLLPNPPIRSSDVLAIAEAFKEFSASRAAWGILYAYVEAYASSLTSDAVEAKKIGDWFRFIRKIPSDKTLALIVRQFGALWVIRKI